MIGRPLINRRLVNIRMCGAKRVGDRVATARQLAETKREGALHRAWSGK